MKAVHGAMDHHCALAAFLVNIDDGIDVVDIGLMRITEIINDDIILVGPAFFGQDVLDRGTGFSRLQFRASDMVDLDVHA